MIAKLYARNEISYNFCDLRQRWLLKDYGWTVSMRFLIEECWQVCGRLMMFLVGLNFEFCASEEVLVVVFVEWRNHDRFNILAEQSKFRCHYDTWESLVVLLKFNMSPFLFLTPYPPPFTPHTHRPAINQPNRIGNKRKSYKKWHIPLIRIVRIENGAAPNERTQTINLT